MYFIFFLPETRTGPDPQVMLFMLQFNLWGIIIHVTICLTFVFLLKGVFVTLYDKIPAKPYKNYIQKLVKEVWSKWFLKN